MLLRYTCYVSSFYCSLILIATQFMLAYIIWIRFVIIDGMWILQTVTLATYVFFIFTVIGRQKLDGIGINMKTERMQSGRLPMDIDIYIPVYTILQFFFYMGLLKVRTRGSKNPRFTTMRNPFQAFVVVQFHPLFVLNPVVIDLYPWNNDVFIKNILTLSN